MSSDNRNPERDIRPVFTATVATWIAASGEVLVILRYLRAAGAKDYALCRTVFEFEMLVEGVPIGADIEVFRQPQLPIRGVVTDAFITDALAAIADGTEYMVVARQREPNSVLSAYGAMSDSHKDLLEDLESLRGQEVALGVCPDFNAPDNPDLISASKGGIDGPR